MDKYRLMCKDNNEIEINDLFISIDDPDLLFKAFKMFIDTFKG